MERRTENKYSGNAVKTAVQIKNKNTDPRNLRSVAKQSTQAESEANRHFFIVDTNKSLSYGYEYNSRNIKNKQIRKAPEERWNMLELISRSGIELSYKEKENLLIFGDIRGWRWAELERQKLSYEFDLLQEA